MSSPNEQNGMNEDGDKAPLSSMICTGWFVTLCKSFTSVRYMDYFQRIPRVQKISVWYL